MKFESNVKPFNHQLKEYMSHGVDKRRALFWEMGTGKSIMTILMLLDKYSRENRVLRTLIVAPLSVLKQWEREFNFVNDELFHNNICILDNSVKGLRKFERSQIVLVNYEKLVSRKYFALLDRSWDVVVLDESHRIKNPKAKCTQAIFDICRLGKKHITKASPWYRYILSGTPNPSSYEDLWTQMYFLDSCILGDNFYVYKSKYFVDHNLPKKHFMTRYFPDWRLRNGAEKEIKGHISRYTSIVRKEECLDLPPLVTIHRFTSLSSEQAKVYKSMEKDFIAFIEDKACVANIALTKLIRLQQILMGFMVTEDGSVTRLKNNRLEVLSEVLQEIPQDKQVIVWTNFKETYKDISKLLDKLGYTYAYYTGIVNKKDKEDALADFRSGKARILVSNPSSGGIGLNLQVASYMVYYQHSYSYMYDAQSEARCYRSGSEIHDKITRIDIITEDSIDMEIMQALECKSDAVDYIMSRRAK